jgi:transposase-like protein
LRVIGEYLLHLQTVERLCIRFGITHSMLYRWFRLFQDHKAEWLGILADLEQVIIPGLRPTPVAGQRSLTAPQHI